MTTGSAANCNNNPNKNRFNLKTLLTLPDFVFILGALTNLKTNMQRQLAFAHRV